MSGRSGGNFRLRFGLPCFLLRCGFHVRDMLPFLLMLCRQPAQLYRIYIERYLCSLPVVNQEMDLIISQKEQELVVDYYSPVEFYL